MADELKKPHKPLTDEELETVRNFKIGEPPFTDSESYDYPPEVIGHWSSIPPEAEVVFPLTRQDLDHLFFSYAQMGASIATLQMTARMIALQDLETADVAYNKSLELRSMADVNFRKFFGAIMSKARTNG